MSYEGYEIWVCENGHRSDFDCYNTPDRSTWHCVCGAPLADSVAVDETNGLPYPLDFKIEEEDGRTKITRCEFYYWPGKGAMHPSNGSPDYDAALAMVHLTEEQIKSAIWQPTLEKWLPPDSAPLREIIIVKTSKGRVLAAQMHPSNGWCYRPETTFAIPVHSKRVHAEEEAEVAVGWMPLPDEQTWQPQPAKHKVPTDPREWAGHLKTLLTAKNITPPDFVQQWIDTITGPVPQNIVDWVQTI